MNATPKHSPAGVFTVVALYALFAALWILLSDRAVGLLISDPKEIVQVSVLKGWFFVAVTSLLLWGLVQRLVDELERSHQRELALEHEREQPPAMLVAIADASTDAIYAKDEQGRYLLFNNEASRIVGRPAEQVLGKDDSALFPPEQAQFLTAVDSRVRASGVAETAEEVLQTARGVRVFLGTKGPLRGADGTVFGTYGISRDITSRKREDEALRLLAEDLDTTLQAIPDLLFEVDAEGRYLKVKASNESLLFAPPAMLLGRTVPDVLPPDAAQTVMQALAAAGRKGSDYGRTIVLPLEGGGRCFELSVARKPVVAHHPDRFIVLSRDITHRMAAEAELRQRNEELERFNRAASDRELRMVALKQEVNALAQAAGRPAPYDVSFADAPGRPAAP